MNCGGNRLPPCPRREMDAVMGSTGRCSAWQHAYSTAMVLDDDRGEQASLRDP